MIDFINCALHHKHPGSCSRGGARSTYEYKALTLPHPSYSPHARMLARAAVTDAVLPYKVRLNGLIELSKTIVHTQSAYRHLQHQRQQAPMLFKVNWTVYVAVSPCAVLL